ncbi:MAG: hypothetical protein DLM72_13820 [Candidatus Nitrosopolaris wilkensis]|nr:MAG: hypothetical protein DLM72_13820 [Candidatus Nitrosopolaris wilkensis]
MSCKNICTIYRTKKSYRGSYYKYGYKRCTDCEIFIKWNGPRCPCCKQFLRIRTHDAKTRKKDIQMKIAV